MLYNSSKILTFKNLLIIPFLALELKDMNHMKKIEFLEDKITKNLDENSYSELIRLKSQINRD